MTETPESPKKKIILKTRTPETASAGEEGDAVQKPKIVIKKKAFDDPQVRIVSKPEREGVVPQEENVTEIAELAEVQFEIQEETFSEPGPPVAEGSSKHFKFFCYRCGQKLQVPVAWSGRQHPCGRCGESILIPEPL